MLKTIRLTITNRLILYICVLLLISIASGCAHGKKSVPETSLPESEISSDSTASPEEMAETDSLDYDAAPEPVATESESAAIPAVSMGEPEDEDFFDDDDGGGEEEFDEDFFEDDDVFSEESTIADPLITWNRAMFVVNDKLYFWCLKPVAQGYNYITPSFFRTGVRNFFHNITTPIRFVSSVLQGKVTGAGSELGRFVVNTTVGVAGVWDPAERYLGWQSSEEDLGQTLGKYQIGNGFYIMWPVIGPSTLRDTVGLAGDSFLNPVAYVRPYELALGINAYERVNSISFRIGDYEAVKSASLDPYVMVRDFYIEYRKKRVAE